MMPVPTRAASIRAALPPALLLAAALATLGFPGCSSLTGPGADGGIAPRMSSLWPNEDGREWTFWTIKRPLASGELLLTPMDQEVPEVTLADARRMLRVDVAPGAGGQEEYAYRMRFAGQVLTRSRVLAQNLEESFVYTRAASATGTGAAGTRPAIRPGDAFLARLAQARPDLRERLLAARPDLRARLDPSANSGYDWWSPILIHGYAWLKAPMFIGAYGDNDTLLAWKFLESNLRPGHEFRFQLLPTVSDDLWLSASVERERTVEVPGVGRVRGAVEVLYLIDYGDATLTHEDGSPRGHLRTFDYGTVVYAPGIGPVSVVERRFGWAGGKDTFGTWELDLSLMSTGVESPPSPVAASR